MNDQIFDSFRMHDQDGLPLIIQWDLAQVHGTHINLAAFACDALLAGWKETKVELTLRDVVPDLDWTEFKFKMAQLFTLAGKAPEPDCWRKMKRYLTKH